ncbi:hypothetical protein EV182_003746 [Spiromyces aspiralis]|uniref:Uncharacterized protein n=1 Tax=Spiromyces aspiralis TaxID=68401 RepID=A0ACC1HDE3_9FUNG|nr:hypothetical protein EV182_003746 [Spiromyces aspiralis]
MASVFLDEMRQVDKLPVNARILNAATLNLYDSGALVRILIDAVSQAQYAAFAPNSQCLTSIIRSCIAENKLDAACVALKAMVEAFMVFPSTKCLVRLVRACKRTGRSDLTHEILELIKNNEIKLA